MTYARPLVFAAVSLALLGGCDTINTTEREQPVGAATPIRDKRVVTDAALDSYARILSVNEAVLPGDVLKVQVTLRNDSPFDQRIIYRFEWFDLQGMAVDAPQSAWKAVSVQGKEVYTISSVAPGPQAKDFRLKLQESKWN